MRYLIVITVTLTLSAFILVSCHPGGKHLPAQEITVQPIFQTNVPEPTQDKPQSKTWYAQGHWWALMPGTQGPVLYKRTHQGWRVQPEATQTMSEQPGKADVYATAQTAMAVLVGPCALTVVALHYVDQAATYIPETLTALPIPDACASIETATLTQDPQGTWWVAADMDSLVLTWASADATTWQGPFTIGQHIGHDDICMIATLTDAVSVIWSDQQADCVWEATHTHGQPADQWTAPTAIDCGHKTADDHLNSTLLKDGTLIVATKNSLDQEDKPQFVLRVRTPQGVWHNLPCVNLTATEQPTRPLITQTPAGHLLMAYTVTNRVGEGSYINLDQVNIPSTLDTLTFKNLLHVRSPHASIVGNATATKAPFPADNNVPWLILFSDKQGRVFEADIRNYIIDFKF